MSDLMKVKIGRITASAAFWMAIVVVYLQNRGLSLSQIYQMLSVYYIAVVLFEFPTGVIGDYFSHRISVMLGHFILGVAFIALALGGGFNYYLAILIFAALGIALSSGSDTALLHSLSKDFKQDQSQIRFYTSLVAVITTTLGSIIASYDFAIPFVATGIFNFATAFLLLFMKNTNHVRKEGNIFKTVFRALEYVKNSKKLMSIMIISGVIGAFSFSIKWFYNPLLQLIDVPLSLWGVLISIALLVPLIGVKIFQKSKSGSLLFALFLFVVSIMPIGIAGLSLIPLIFLYFNGAIRGYLEAFLDVEANNAIETSERASILSLNNLLIRLGASVYTPIAGLVLEKNSFIAMTSGTAILIFLIVAYPVFLLNRRK
ncbi:MFS transporter [Candidatus Gottesmanbacteria bacterium]|nr:MFS transporter [Candidatus Gottesmanbacteria bacterium]